MKYIIVGITFYIIGVTILHHVGIPPGMTLGISFIVVGVSVMKGAKVSLKEVLDKYKGKV